MFDQILLYHGDNTYNGKPPFHGAIMNSGGLILADPSDFSEAQSVFRSKPFEFLLMHLEKFRL